MGDRKTVDLENSRHIANVTNYGTSQCLFGKAASIALVLGNQKLKTQIMEH